MNLKNFLNNRIENAKRKLENHSDLGSKSNLSIYEVAELRDIVNGTEDLLPEKEERYFMGLHSLN